MNIHMIRILILKDLRLLLVPALLYSALGIAAVCMLGVAQQAFFYGGTVLLITAMMALGFHPPMATVVGERKEHTLAFIMSMPITPADYTCSKLLVNMVLFFLPWSALVATTFATIVARSSLPDGLIPYASILFGTVALSAVLILCVGIVTESMQWTIATQIISNLAFQAVMYAASNASDIKASMTGDTIVWSATALTFLAVQLGTAVLAICATLWLQARKTDFI
ncbi:hypothetical protein [Massilia sp. CF038]|uniref:hypothetical protein n=1 Tax=Massilia sp. CF038 TaxID=1881045 RepID=UPI000922B5B6|nr:hypothetical protein [Massilia sp. CF038]SHH10974.1 hypothetical protein SAMN05428948_2817 [Massilia sp. CF038]